MCELRLLVILYVVERVLLKLWLDTKESYEIPLKLKVSNHVIYFCAQDRYRLHVSLDFAATNKHTHENF